MCAHWHASDAPTGTFTDVHCVAPNTNSYDQSPLNIHLRLVNTQDHLAKLHKQDLLAPPLTLYALHRFQASMLCRALLYALRCA